MNTKLETFRYDDKIARLFFGATLIWGVTAFIAGVTIATLLFLPQTNLAPYLTFGRLRPRCVPEILPRQVTRSLSAPKPRPDSSRVRPGWETPEGLREADERVPSQTVEKSIEGLA